MLFSMATPPPPTVLALGHSFVRRMAHDLKANFDPRASETFNLEGNIPVHLHGIGGRTVRKLIQFDLDIISALTPDVVILEIGTNDLSMNRQEVAGSDNEEFVRLLCRDHFGVDLGTDLPGLPLADGLCF